MVPFVNRTFEWGVAIANFLSVSSIVPLKSACWTCFLHPKLRKINAVPITPRLITLAMRRLPRTGRIPTAQAFLRVIYSGLQTYQKEFKELMLGLADADVLLQTECAQGWVLYIHGVSIKLLTCNAKWTVSPLCDA